MCQKTSTLSSSTNTNSGQAFKTFDHATKSSVALQDSLNVYLALETILLKGSRAHLLGTRDVDVSKKRTYTPTWCCNFEVDGTHVNDGESNGREGEPEPHPDLVKWVPLFEKFFMPGKMMPAGAIPSAYQEKESYVLLPNEAGCAAFRDQPLKVMKKANRAMMEVIESKDHAEISEALSSNSPAGEKRDRQCERMVENTPALIPFDKWIEAARLREAGIHTRNTRITNQTFVSLIRLSFAYSATTPPTGSVPAPAPAVPTDYDDDDDDDDDIF